MDTDSAGECIRVALCHMDIGDVEWGGICTLYKNLALVLNDLGADVHIISAREISMPSRITTHRINLTSVGPPFTADTDTLSVQRDAQLLHAYSQHVANLINTIDPDVAECSTWAYELLSYATKKRRRTSVVVRADLSARTMGATALEDGEYNLLRFCDCNIFTSRYARRDIFASYGVSNGPVIHLGVSPSCVGSTNALVDRDERSPRAVGQGDKQVRIVWVGKGTKMKGYDILADIITQSPPSMEFILVMGHAHCEYEPINSPNVSIVHDLNREDYWNLLRSADVFLSTSRW